MSSTSASRQESRQPRGRAWLAQLPAFVDEHPDAAAVVAAPLVALLLAVLLGYL